MRKGAIGIGALGVFFVIFSIATSLYTKCTCGIAGVLLGVMLVCFAVLNR